MVIASRTPEGEPAKCPICGEAVLIEPSINFSDAPCPSCGSLLWFVRLGEQDLFFQWDEARREKLLRMLAELTGLNEPNLEDLPELIERLEMDPVDIADILVEVEDEFSDGSNQ